MRQVPDLTSLKVVEYQAVTTPGSSKKRHFLTLPPDSCTGFPRGEIQFS